MSKNRRLGPLGDPHLYHRIKEFVEVQESGSASSADTVEYLRNRFPEYARKQVSILTKHVQAGISKS